LNMLTGRRTGKESPKKKPHLFGEVGGKYRRNLFGTRTLTTSVGPGKKTLPNKEVKHTTEPKNGGAWGGREFKKG